MIGARLGPYEIVAPLGAGGMGEVYRARDTRLGRNVAIKVLRAEVAGDPERVKRFEKEARTVASMSHPNILALFDVGSHQGQPYLVTELLEGQTLAERIRAGDLTVAKAVELATQIAHGLAAAHEHGIVHRDLKPGNVFVTKDGVVKILDFGLARLTHIEAGAWDPATASTETGLTGARAVLGTVGYMAPEQARGLPADHRSDIFAFGCVLYEMLAGERAFRGDSATDVVAAILKDDPAPLPAKVPPMLDTIIRRCLEKRSEERFSSAHDLGFALEAVSTAPRPEALGKKPNRIALRLSPIGRLGRPAASVAALLSPLRSRALVSAVAALAVGVAGVAGSISVLRQRRVAWARNVALPELARLADGRDYWPAFLLARKIEAVVPGDPMLEKLRPLFSGEFRRKVIPASAKVFSRPRDGGEEDWVELGTAGGAPLFAPLGYSVFRVHSPQLETRELAMNVLEFPWYSYHLGGAIVLAEAGACPAGMVRVECTGESVWLGTAFGEYDVAGDASVASFFADIHEVTNREYQRFVDARGYERREYWSVPFERNGVVLPWEDGIVLLRDATGRPGPAAWEFSRFPPGKDDLPVTGVSWYEAAAYAAFAGKRLPSVYHWLKASAAVVGGDFVAGSNFSRTLAAVGSFRGGCNPWGLFDAAGNAREWCTNASGSERFALGGACDDPAYMFWNPVTKSPFEREPTTGFRCVKPVAPEPQETRLDAAIARKAPIDWGRQRPFSEEAWRTWRRLLSYGKSPLNARVEWVDDTLPSWRMEKVSFAAAYAGDRVVAYLFLPRSVPPPWQAVVFWPGGYAALMGSSADGRNTMDASYWSYLVKDGRAVLYPILKGTFERGGRADRVVEEASLDERIVESKDIFRSLDYLETRPDVQKDRIGYLGFSWGACTGPIVCAVDDRIKVAVLQGGMICDAEQFGFIRRCSTPTQMVNGRFDGFAQRQAPMFRALATATDAKRHVVFDADHAMSGFERDAIRVNLEWFDRFLGPVR